METVFHEICHHWQQMLGENPYKPASRVTHNKEFNEKMEQLGIHCAPEGYHTRIADMDKPFGILMKEWGIEPPADVPVDKDFKIHWFKDHFKGKERKGRSTLRKYQCPDCGVSVRWGRKAEPDLLHVPCGSVLIDASKGNVYEKSTTKQE